tara:strand:- start:110 stop:832 length:723 start_codon:yes stop_codon:yes gene_type:complete
MAGPYLPKGKVERAVVGGIAATLLLTFGVTIKGALGGNADAPATGAVKPQPAAAAPLDSAPDSAQPKPPQSGKASLSASPSDPKTSIMQTVSRFRVKRVLKIDHPLNHGDYVWDDKDVPAGPIMVTVDLKAQTLSVFRGGYEIGVAVILYGADDKESPLGVYPITQKDADHYSNLYNNAPMPYALRLTNDGVFIHGSDVEYGEATHGCIGIPKAFAKKLFEQAKLGDLVIITDGKMMDLG